MDAYIQHLTTPPLPLVGIAGYVAVQKLIISHIQKGGTVKPMSATVVNDIREAFTLLGKACIIK